VTDVQSRGLIPQLTDLLHALTESHELLIVKLQTLRQEQRHGYSWVTGDSSSLETLHPNEPSTELAANSRTDAAITAPTATCTIEPDSVGREDPVSARPSTEAIPAAEPRHAASSEPTTLLNASNNDGAPRSVHEPAIPAQFSATTTPSDSENGTTNRNYNFFDELDARLTHLKDSDSKPRDERSA
jgi:hypothetical protein